MNGSGGYLFGPVAAIRPYLFQKCLLLIVGADALVLMTERGARYGIDRFNVAHFEWLDAMQPIPSAEWYVGVLMAVSIMAFTNCFYGSSRKLLAVLAVVYTYAWSMSRHDSYLHHYMLSLILCALVCIPKLTFADLLATYQQETSPQRASGKKQRRNTSQTGVSVSGAWLTVGLLLIALLYRTIDVLASSWIAFFVFFALASAVVLTLLRRCEFNVGPLACAWGFRLLGATVGVIYIFTSIAKMDIEWCGGYTIQQVGQATNVLAPVVSLFDSFGVPADWFWAVAATAVIPVELTIAASYFLAVQQDEPGRKWLPRWCVIAFLIAIGLHLNNEFMGLSIQWFGYYMMFLATFFFLPQRVLLAAGLCVIVVAHWWHTRIVAPLARRFDSMTLFGMSILFSAMALTIVAGVIDLPGVPWAISLVGFGGLMTAGALWIARPQQEQRLRTIELMYSVGVSAIVMSVIVAQSSMRHDYYYVLGTELQNLQLPNQERQLQQRALAAFEHAERFGPPNEKRHVELLMRMGMSSRRLEDLSGAVSYYRRAIKMAPNDVLLYLNLGVAYQTAGDVPRAIQAFRQAIEADPQSAAAHHELGRTMEAQGDLRAALKSLRMAQRLDSNNLQLQRDIAALLKKRRTDDTAQ